MSKNKDMASDKKIRVLMLGADRTVHGGVSAVVNHYYGAGLNERVKLCYIGTMVDGSKWRKLIQAVWAYMRFLIKLPAAQVVHVHMAADASYYRKSIFINTAHMVRKPLIIHEHGGDFQNFYYQKSEKKRKRIRNTLNKADRFLVLSQEWKDFFLPIVNPEKIEILENGIPVRERQQKDYSNRKAVFLGRLASSKGIRELLESIPAIRADYPELELYLGGIWEESRLEKLAEQYQDTVHFLGWINEEQKDKLLQECSIFVLPTYFEGQPISLLEAMEAGCAVVVSEVGGIPQIVKDQVNGIFIQPKSTQSLTEGMKQVLAQADIREKLGTAARKTVQENYDIRTRLDRLTEIYAQLQENGS